jgi:protein YibB
MYTIVTGLFDIGRGEWCNYRRPIEHYMYFFANVLRLKAPMVIFCEEKFINLVNHIRNSMTFETTVIKTNLTDLYMNKYKDLLFEIQNDPDYGKEHPHPVCPEIAIPMYSLVVSSKPDLLYQGTKYAKTDYCIWLDGGYTHGSIDISKIEWNPTSLFNIKDKISIIGLRPMSDMATSDPVGFSNQYIDIINGGFFGGHKNTIEKVRNKYYQIVDEMLTKYRVKEDDQYYWTFLAYKHPEMINFIHGSWYDAFKIQ